MFGKKKQKQETLVRMRNLAQLDEGFFSHMKDGKDMFDATAREIRNTYQQLGAGITQILYPLLLCAGPDACESICRRVILADVPSDFSLVGDVSDHLEIAVLHHGGVADCYAVSETAKEQLEILGSHQ